MLAFQGILLTLHKKPAPKAPNNLSKQFITSYAPVSKQASSHNSRRLTPPLPPLSPPPRPQPPFLPPDMGFVLDMGILWRWNRVQLELHDRYWNPMDNTGHGVGDFSDANSLKSLRRPLSGNSMTWLINMYTGLLCIAPESLSLKSPSFPLIPQVC